MAIIANRTIVRNREPRVIEGGSCPRGRRVARVAGGRITRRNVIRHRAAQSLRAVPIRLVTAVARCIGGVQRIVVANMAQSAGGGKVRACQCPTSRGVIKRSVRPQKGVVTGGAERGWVLRGHVIWHRAAESLRAVPVRGVTTRVIAIRNRQTVVVADVALVAVRRCAGGSHLVVAGESPASVGGVAPGSGSEVGGNGVAVRAVCRREGRARRRVHRIVRTAVIAGMTVGVTATAGCRQVVAAGRGAVALRALHRGVQAG